MASSMPIKVLGLGNILLSDEGLGIKALWELKEKYELVEFYDNGEEGLSKALELIKNDDSKKQWKLKRDKLIKEKIDVTSYMIEFINSYI